MGATGFSLATLADGVLMEARNPLTMAGADVGSQARGAAAEPSAEPPVLLLLFSAGGPLYAMESRDVVEVIPRVSLRPAVNLPSPVAGLFNYRGVVVPVVDLCQVIDNRPSGENLSSRIIMVRASRERGSDRHIGLLAEGVTDTISRPLSAFQVTGLDSGSRAYLGGLTLDERGMVQILHLQVLLDQIIPLHDLIPEQP